MDSRLEKWGDYHFGRSLAKYLRRFGEEVETDYQPAWATAESCDVVVVLRGKFSLKEEERQAGAFHVIWNMSHPESVSLDEYQSYDLVLVASNELQRRLTKELSVPVASFLQCTDLEEFYERPDMAGVGRKDFIFVGNTREERRDGIIWAVEAGWPVRIWGRGWSKWLPHRYIISEYVPNENLGALYSTARITFNDHWPDMRRSGFINNRIFDALACGLPVISDRHQALEKLFPGEVLFYENRQDLAGCMEECILAYSRVEERARSALSRIKSEFSFAMRAEELHILVADRMGRRLLNRHRSKSASVERQNDHSFIPTPSEGSFWCPVCGQFCTGFLPFGIRRRPAARCPNCGSLERHRSAWLFLRSRTNLCDGERKVLLHCSPEEHLRRVFEQLPGVKRIGVDLSPSHRVALALDLTRMPLAESSLDCVYCSHVLEHIEDDASAISELYTALRPSGWALFMTPIKGNATYENLEIRSETERLLHFGQKDHVRIYGRDLGTRLGKSGFEVEEVTGDLGFSRLYQQFLGLKRPYLYYCRKPDGPSVQLS